jgi:hypothetical protein
MITFRDEALRQDSVQDSLRDIIDKLGNENVDWSGGLTILDKLNEDLSDYDIYRLGPGRHEPDDLDHVLSLLRFLKCDLSPRDLSIPPPEQVGVTLPGNRLSALHHAQEALQIVSCAKSRK